MLLVVQCVCVCVCDIDVCVSLTHPHLHTYTFRTSVTSKAVTPFTAPYPFVCDHRHCCPFETFHSTRCLWTATMSSVSWAVEAKVWRPLRGGSLMGVR